MNQAKTDVRGRQWERGRRTEKRHQRMKPRTKSKLGYPGLRQEFLALVPMRVTETRSNTYKESCPLCSGPSNTWHSFFFLFVIARVNPIEVQWKCLTLRGLPPCSQCLPCEARLLTVWAKRASYQPQLHYKCGNCGWNGAAAFSYFGWKQRRRSFQLQLPHFERGAVV